MVGRARHLLNVDVLAEAVCAVGLAALALTGGNRVGAWALPSWVSQPLLWVVATVFAGTAVGLFALAEATRCEHCTHLSLIGVLGAVNASLAVVIAVWSIVAAGFGGGSRFAFVAVALAILLLGVSQMVGFSPGRATTTRLRAPRRT